MIACLCIINRNDKILFFRIYFNQSRSSSASNVSKKCLRSRSFKEIAQNARKGIQVDGGQYIYVFNLKGEPLCKYVLDHCIYGISVNEQKGTILATDVNKDEPIIEYTMK